MKSNERIIKLTEEFKIEELQERLEFTTLTSGTSTAVSGNYAAGDVIYNVTESQIAQAKAATAAGNISVGTDFDEREFITIIKWEF